MKSLYPISQVNFVPAFFSLRNSLKHLFLLWFISFSVISAFSQGLVFQNARLESGTPGANKAVYRFPNVKTGLDALVTIKGRSDNKVTLSNIDETSTGFQKSFQPKVSYGGGTAPGNASWYMDFDITLVKAGTKTPTKVAEVDATALDIDGNDNKLREFVVFNDPLMVTTEKVSSLKIDENPVIDFDAEDGEPVICGTCKQSSVLVLCSTCSGSGLIKTLVNGILKTNNCSKCNATGKLYSGCGHAYKISNSGTGSGKAYTYYGPTTTFASIDTFATQVMVTGTWADVDQLTFRIGGENLASTSQGGADRMYSIRFKEFRYLGASMLPVKLSDWKAAAAKTGVDLQWTAELERNTSRFVIERSIDGRNFTAIGEVAAAGNSDVKRNYSYNDAQLSNTAGMIYYRLVTIDRDGKTDYSLVRTVRVATPSALASNGNLAISTYPNPTVDALNVTVPANWQGKKVTFEIYNVNGTLVKAVVNNHASQVENMHITELGRGLYIVKATAGEQSASQRIVKSN